MIKSAKEILLNNDILNQNLDSKKHPKHEFQAYAYRLASDLNDLARLKLYMRLSKTIERSLLEQAYAYVIDSSIDDKGKLFLWKVKQLRAQIQKQKVINSYDYETTSKHNTRLRNALSKNLIENATERFWDIESKALKDAFNYIFDNAISQKVLVIGLEMLPVLDLISLFPVKLTGIDSSKEIAQKAKKYMLGSKLKPKPKLIVKDLLSNTFEDNYFDIIIVQSGWNALALDSEKKYLLALKAKLATNGTLLIRVSHSSITNQLWNSMVIKGIEYLFLKKSQTQDDFTIVCESVGLEITNRFIVDGYTYFSVRHIAQDSF